MTTFENLSNLDEQQKQRIRNFKTDCLIWMLFNGSNLTASANDLEWNGKKWSIVNHFIPFTEEEVGSPDRFESDFMVQYLASLRGTKQSLNTSQLIDLGNACSTKAEQPSQ